MASSASVQVESSEPKSLELSVEKAEGVWISIALSVVLPLVLWVFGGMGLATRSTPLSLERGRVSCGRSVFIAVAAD